MEIREYIHGYPLTSQDIHTHGNPNIYWDQCIHGTDIPGNPWISNYFHGYHGWQSFPPSARTMSYLGTWWPICFIRVYGWRRVVSGYIFRYWLCLGKLMTQIFCGIYWHHGVWEALCQTPHRSAQSPHRCSQVRTGPSRCVWGVPKLRKKVPEVPKSPNPNRTGRFTHPHSFTHTPSGCRTFSKNLDLCCCYCCCCCWRPLAPNRTNGQQLLCAGWTSVTSALATVYQ